MDADARNDTELRNLFTDHRYRGFKRMNARRHPTDHFVAT
jgi:hypothetical protein